MDEKAQEKKNKYSSLVLLLKRLYPRWKITHHTFIMGVLTTFQQPYWDAYFKQYGMTFTKGRKIQLACVRECVLAAHRLHNTRRSRLEALCMKGASLMPRSGSKGVNPIPPAGIG